MEWTTVKITSDKRGRNTPYASIGFGKIALSAAACELIDNYELYPYVELLRGKRNNKLCIGVRFIKNTTQDSIKIKRRISDGKAIAGLTIENKGIVEELFGITGTARKTTRYNVEKDNDEDNILIIYGE
ncbi:MAG TPA: hypothetical protein H9683_01740 [Firmicutes bacterium]|nr:hypothetical protein [Bacillota bacterium]